jgi:hypothetical protein
VTNHAGGAGRASGAGQASRAGRARDAHRMAGRPFQGRSRKRWAAAGAAAALLLFLYVVTGSVIASLVVLVALGLLTAVCAAALRSLGISWDHPVVRSLGTRPWRDGREVLTLALKHLPEVFLITPSGSLLAPNAIELCMNPADVESLADRIDLEIVNESAAEAYADVIAQSGARVRAGQPIEVAVVSDATVGQGRYVLRQRRQRSMAMDPAGDWPVAAGQVPGPALGAGRARAGIARVRAALTGERAQLPATEAMTAGAMLTDAEPARPLLAPNPMLRLTTGDSVTQTRVSGARAGRGRGTELMLPDEPTLSRVHARFSCAGGQWRITAVGRNGVLVNDVEPAGEQVIRDGDVIQWGRQENSPRSWVEIVP